METTKSDLAYTSQASISDNVWHIDSGNKYGQVHISRDESQNNFRHHQIILIKTYKTIKAGYFVSFWRL